MKLNVLIPLCLLAVAAIIIARNPQEAPIFDGYVTTAEEQTKLTPDEVLSQFKEGNKRVHSGTETRRNHSEQVRKSAPGLFPKAMVLSCLDSRVPVEDVFDQGIGDVFVG